MTLEEFEKETAAAIRALPAFFRERLENVAVLVRARPNAVQAKRFGPGLLGLYEGVSHLDRAQSYSGAMPDKITLFKINIEAEGGDIKRGIRNVLMHEIAHHFGMDDEELMKKGLY